MNKPQICVRCDDIVTEDPKDHAPPCRIPQCKAPDHSTCEH